MRKEMLMHIAGLLVRRFEGDSGRVHRKWIQNLSKDIREPEILITVAEILSSSELNANEALAELKVIKSCMPSVSSMTQKSVASCTDGLARQASLAAHRS